MDAGYRERAGGKGHGPCDRHVRGRRRNGHGELFSDLESLEQYVDLIPNTRRPEGRADVIVVSVNPPDYECGVRTAIDYAALFNRKNCKRVWVISDTFIFSDTIHYAAHVDALAEQGVALRFILVTPWGWVEIPLSVNIASNQQFLWHNTMRGTRGH